MTIPTHKPVTFTTTYLETLSGIMIPMSLKANADVEREVSSVKSKFRAIHEDKFANAKASVIAEGLSFDDLKKVYVDAKITIELSRLGEQVDEKRLESQRKKRFDLLVADKNASQLVDELASLYVDIEERRMLLTQTVSRTLWNVLRKSTDIKQKMFTTVDELEDSLDENTMLAIFNQNESNQITDEQAKN